MDELKSSKGIVVELLAYGTLVSDIMVTPSLVDTYPIDGGLDNNVIAYSSLVEGIWVHDSLVGTSLVSSLPISTSITSGSLASDGLPVAIKSRSY